MNTPAHAVVNLLLLGRQDRPAWAAPILTGAILPDAPMVGFYAYQKLVRGAAESAIWGEIYFEPHWQALFDGFHSVPFAALVLGVALVLGRPGVALLCGSVLLHALLDFPFHHDDAHRHFFPLLDWKFASPVSYWNPAHYGDLFLLVEAVVVVVGTVVLLRRERGWTRSALLVIAGSYAGFWAFGLWMWA